MKNLFSTTPQWTKFLKEEFDSDEYGEIENTLTKLYESKVQIFPPKKEVFNAFNLLPLDKVRVVVIGQDPYHDDHQAHGLAFSVPHGEKIPPSLRNIFKEITSSLNTPPPLSGNLEHWATQGVLLLNTCFTVEAHKANSHKDIGWQWFTDRIIEKVSRANKNLVFLLWGAQARSKVQLIEGDHLILESAHPSPLSAHRGFLGNQHFVLCNNYLKEKNKRPIEWI